MVYWKTTNTKSIMRYHTLPEKRMEGTICIIIPVIIIMVNTNVSVRLPSNTIRT